MKGRDQGQRPLGDSHPRIEQTPGHRPNLIEEADCGGGPDFIDGTGLGE